MKLLVSEFKFSNTDSVQMILKSLDIIVKWTYLPKLLTGEALELRRVCDLFLSFTLKLFPFVLQLRRDSSTKYKKRWFTLLKSVERFCLWTLAVWPTQLWHVLWVPSWPVGSPGSVWGDVFVIEGLRLLWFQSRLED